MNDADNNKDNYDSNMGSDPDRPSDETKLIDSPPPGFKPSKNPNDISLDPAYLDQDSHDHHHELDSHPQIFDSHSSYPFDGDSLKNLHGFDAFPEVLHDHNHHDEHDFFEQFHHPIPLPPPTTTIRPLPPPPPEEEPEEEPEEQPRVKKYSYFYLSRSLWYIPLYFTVWFTFYVTWLILQSIGRHKVNI